MLKGATGTVTFVVKAIGKVIQQVTDTADGKLKDFDTDLSAVKGTVLAGPGSTKNFAVWQDLRLAPQIG